MIAFAALLERLLYTQASHDKQRQLRAYFATTPDPDRGLALAAIAGTLRVPAAKPALIRDLAAARTDSTLFALSHDFVGDLAETTALIWPDSATNAPSPSLAEVVTALATTPKPHLPAQVAAWLDTTDPSTRLALLKLITGTLRIGATAYLARIALADLSQDRATAEDIEEIWHSQPPPYTALFAWLEGRAPRPDPQGAPVFRPPMLAHPIEPADLATIDPATTRAEWKWDGIRVQLVATQSGTRLYSRNAEDISASFPEITAAMTFHAVLDGELLVIRNTEVAPFADLQHRLNRKTITTKIQADYPVAIRLYDLLFDGTEDLRPLPFDTRRARLEAWFAHTNPARMDLSPLIPFTTIADLAALRETARAAATEGLMLKSATSPYLPGRPKGHWWKWKRDPLTIDAVLMYAQRGQGRSSGTYADYTFGLWREDHELVPVGKANADFTDQERAFLDRWIRANTTQSFGPVREVARALVLEIAFDGVQRSPRHKSGLALRVPRITRLRPDKPAAEADRLDALLHHLP